MTDVQALFWEMETLSLSQLEKLHDYINNHPYKVEKRPPTQAELEEVMAELRRIVAEPAPDESDDPLERIEAMMEKRRIS